MPRILVTLLIFVASTDWATADDHSEKMVGAWRLVKSDDKVPGRIVVAFNPGGVAVFQLTEANRKPESSKAVWRVVGTALYVCELTERNTPQEPLRIVRLSETSLIVQDGAGKRTVFARIK